MIINKRIIREFTASKTKYLSIFIVIVISIYTVVSMSLAAETVINGVSKNASVNNIEDGQFQLSSKLTDEEIKLVSDSGIILESSFYFNENFYKKKLRVYSNRDYINTISIDSGRIAKDSNEIVLEKHFAKKNSLNVGESFVTENLNLNVVGIGSVPDYNDVLENLTDVSSNSNMFGIGFVDEKFFDEVSYDKQLTYVYSYILTNNQTQNDLLSTIQELKNKRLNENIDVNTNNSNIFELIYTLDKDDNPRIMAAVKDIQVNKNGSLITGVIVLILLCVVLSTFITSSIDRESKQIGTLLSLGYKKNTLIKHYLLLPLLICTLSGIIGTILGVIFVSTQISTSSDYYSYPNLDVVYPIYLILYGIFAPILICTITCIFFVNNKISKKPLDLLRNKRDINKIKILEIEKFGYINTFRIRLFLREIKSNLTIVIGNFVALLLIMLSFTIYSSLTNIVSETKNDVKFNYMYEVDNLQNVETSGSEKVIKKMFQKRYLKNDFKITMLGIDKKSEFFPFDINVKEDEIYISSSVSQKFDVQEGDYFAVLDDESNTNKEFKVKKVVNYAPGLNIFMEQDTMNRVFNNSKSIKNQIYSNTSLDKSNQNIKSSITKKVIVSSTETFYELMKGMVYTLIFSSIIIFVTVMSLMERLIIQHQTTTISMFKLFGYNKSEISKLFLKNNFYVVLISTLIFLPITKYIIDSIYPFLVANRNVGFNLHLSVYIYILILIIIITSYIISRIFSSRDLKNIEIQEILKERE